MFCFNKITESSLKACLIFSGVNSDFKSGVAEAFAGAVPGVAAAAGFLLSKLPSRFPATGNRLLSSGINAAKDIGALNAVSSNENDFLVLLIDAEDITEKF